MLTNQIATSAAGLPGRALLRPLPKAVALQARARAWSSAPTYAVSVPEVRSALPAPHLHSRQPRSSMRLLSPITSASSFQAGLRPRIIAAPSIPSSNVQVALRPYSTLPNQNQVFQSFGTPFGVFVRTISRIARIIAATALAVGLAAYGIYAGTHAYIERVSMPRARAAAEQAALGAGAQDEFGWAGDSLADSAWGPPGLPSGTDARLSGAAREAVRGAWVAITQGGGISPSLFLQSTPEGSADRETARIALREAAQSNDASIDAGLQLVENYLETALAEADRAGFRVPDAVAVAHAIRNSQPVPIDPTAAALEAQLAEARARMGTPRTMALAIEGYERLFNAFGNVTDDDVQAACYISTQRMVRIAGRIAALYQGLGRREEAEQWYLRGIEMVPVSGGSIRKNGSVPAEAVVKANPATTRALVQTLLGLSSLYASPPPAASAPGKLEIDPAFRANLEKALGIQTSVLRILRLELQRLSAHSESSSSAQSSKLQAEPALASSSAYGTSSSPALDAVSTTSPREQRLHADAGRDKELYWLWALHHDGQASMYVAETIYALQLEKAASQSSLLASSGSAGALLAMLKGAFSGGAGSARGTSASPAAAAAASKRYAQSIAWIQEAQAAAERVFVSLISAQPAAPLSGGGQSHRGKKPQLAERWRQDPWLRAPAQRLLRDARRMDHMADEMVDALERSA